MVTDVKLWWYVCFSSAILCSLLDLTGAQVEDTVLRLRCPPAPARCQEGQINRNEHFFNIEDVTILIEFVDGEHFKLTCADNVTLATAALPRFDRLVTVRSAFLECPAPLESYSGVLGTLNLTTSVLDKLDVKLTVGDILPAHAFYGLPALRFLKLIADGSPVSLPALPATLIELELQNMHMSEADLDRLPVTLQVLSVTRGGLTALPTASLARLPELRLLTVKDESFVELGAAVRLQELYVDGPLERSASQPELESVILFNPVSVTAAPWAGCARLKSLYVQGARGAVPPWLVSGCKRLEVLNLLSWSELSSLPEDLLSETWTLRNLTVSSCRSLTSLPAGLFRNMTRIEQIVFSDNALKTLPSSLLGGLQTLRRLDLSGNRLGLVTIRNALQPLGSRPLDLLSLARNPLRGMCGGGTSQVRVFSSSPTASLTVSTLDLSETGLTDLCDDWGTGCGVRKLVLRRNHLERVPLRQLLWPCTANIDLTDNPLRSLSVSLNEYRELLQSNWSPALANVSVEIDSPLDCDCNMYWFAELRRSGRDLPAFSPLQCRSVADTQLKDLVPLASVPQRDLQCRAESALCPPDCACYVRAAPPAGIVVRCDRANLRHLPRLPIHGVPYVEVSVSHNSLSALNLSELPSSMVEVVATNNSLSSLRVGHGSVSLVDVRHNLLSSVDAVTAAWLVAGGRRVAMSGNPLRCDCREPLPRALYDHRTQLEDYDNVTCADGRLLAAAMLECVDGVGGGAVMAASAAVGGALVLTVALLLAVRLRPRLVARLKDALLRRGVCVTWALRAERAGDEDEDELHEFDAFVSFAHEDREWVCGALVPDLERRGYRVCVHYRDFAPGELVATQILRVVRRSRVTLLVVTRALADSKWGRAEFLTATSRAARDARPRLLAVLLDREPPGGLPADWEDHLRQNTYLSRQDPWFWPRLIAALGPPMAKNLPRAPCVSVLSS